MSAADGRGLRASREATARSWYPDFRVGRQRWLLPAPLLLLLILLLEPARCAPLAVRLDPAFISTHGNTTLTAQLTGFSCRQENPRAVYRLSVQKTSFGGAASADSCSAIVFSIATQGDLLPGVWNASIVGADGAPLAAAAAAAAPLSLTVFDAPTVQLGNCTLRNKTELVISVLLQGSSPLPTTVNVSLGNAKSGRPQSSTALQVTWHKNDAAAKQVVVHLAAAPLAANGALTASLVPIDNAVVNGTTRLTTVVVPPPPLFSFKPNAVLYRSSSAALSNVSIVFVANTTSAFPSTLTYTTFAILATGCDEPLSSCDELFHVSGTLVVPANSAPPPLVLAVNWTLLPYDLEARVGLRLAAVANAAASNQSSAIALSVFGVPAGHCPPGTTTPVTTAALVVANRTGGAAPMSAPVVAPGAGQGALYGAATALTSMYLQGNCSGSLCVGDADLPFNAMDNAFTLLIPFGVGDPYLVLVRSTTSVTINITASNCSVIPAGARHPSPPPAAHPLSPPPPAKKQSTVELAALAASTLAAAAAANASALLSMVPLTGQSTMCTVALAVAAPAAKGVSALNSSYVVTFVPLSDMSRVYMAALAYVDLQALRFLVLCGTPAALLARVVAGGAVSAANAAAALSAAIRGNATAAALLSGGSSAAPGGDDTGMFLLPPAATGVNASASLTPAAGSGYWVQYNEHYTPACSTNYKIVAPLSALTANVSLVPEGPAGTDLDIDAGGTFSLGGADADAASNSSSDGMVEFPVILHAPDNYQALTYTVMLYSSELLLEGYLNKSLSTTAVGGGAGGALGAGGPPPPPPTPGVASLAAAGGVVWPPQNCSTCPKGMYSGHPDGTFCFACPPGKYASSVMSSQCDACAPGYFAFTFGSTFCRPCLAGTYASSVGSVSCNMCPSGWTTSVPGSPACDVDLWAALAPAPKGKGGDDDDDPTYALVVTFAVVLDFGVNGSASNFSDWSADLGINGSSITILQWFIQTDTASALDIGAGAVSVSLPAQVSRYSYLVNVSATVQLAAGSAAAKLAAAQYEGAAAAASELAAAPGSTAPKDLNADQLVQKLVNDPATFARTSKATGANVQVSNVQQHVVRLPGGPDNEGSQLSLALILGPTLAGSALLTVALAWGCCTYVRRRRRAGSVGLACLPGFSSCELDYRRWHSDVPLGWPASQVQGVPALAVEMGDLGAHGRDATRLRTRSKPNSMVGLAEFQAEVHRGANVDFGMLYNNMMRGAGPETMHPRL